MKNAPVRRERKRPGDAGSAACLREGLRSAFVLAVVLSAGSQNNQPAASMPRATARTITLTSPAFAAGAPIPKKYTCDGKDASPPLKWGGVPLGTRSLALICDDPDAPSGTWVHWVIYAIPPATVDLPEGVPARATLSSGARQGTNDFKRTGYGGPCPPPGTPHHYVFRIYALDQAPALGPGATQADLLRAMQGHVLSQGQLMGTYRRA
jgi:Raf kinase inhibitor-like YbhB/YbcL family protein